jgi:hypothetical protein
MTRDLQEIKAGLAQARAALNLLEKFIAEYEARMVNILPTEDVKFCAASDDELISSPGLGELTSLNESIHATAQSLRPVTEPRP